MKLTFFFNGTILTFDKTDTKVGALAIYDDKILCVGSEKKVRDHITHFLKTTQSETTGDIDREDIDLQGKCMVPGFIDSHMHPVLAIYYRTQLLVSTVTSYSDLTTIVQKEAQNKQEGEWICCLDFMEDRFLDPKERYFPTKTDLDQIWSQHPLLLLRHDGHICTVNSLGLEQIGISQANIAEFQSESGKIKTFKNGEPNGILTERATALALNFLPLPNSADFTAACLKFSAEYASYGITTIGGMLQTDEKGVSGSMGAMEVPLMQQFIKEGTLEQDYVFYLDYKKAKKLPRIANSFGRISGPSGRYQVGGMKIFTDGGFGARTAYMFEPFSDSDDNESGYLVISQEDLYTRIADTLDLGFQVACHSIGDKANHLLVNLYEKYYNSKKVEDPNADVDHGLLPNQFRIEHASAITRDILTKAAKLGIAISTQPAFIDSEHEWLENRLGSERIKYVYPFRSILDAGVVLAGASDHPVESASILNAIQTCVTRQGFVVEQAISPYEALKMYTYNAACVMNQQAMKGSLEPGKLADLVIMEKDVRQIPADQIGMTKIVGTYHRGRRIFPI